jgi:hypothetical protein
VNYRDRRCTGRIAVLDLGRPIGAVAEDDDTSVFARGGRAAARDVAERLMGVCQLVDLRLAHESTAIVSDDRDDPSQSETPFTDST